MNIIPPRNFKFKFHVPMRNSTTILKSSGIRDKHNARIFMSFYQGKTILLPKRALYIKKKRELDWSRNHVEARFWKIQTESCQWNMSINNPKRISIGNDHQKIGKIILGCNLCRSCRKMFSIEIPIQFNGRKKTAKISKQDSYTREKLNEYVRNEKRIRLKWKMNTMNGHAWKNHNTI